MLATLVSLLITLVISLITLFFNLLPSFDWPDLGGYLTSSGIIDYFAYLNWFFPVSLALGITIAWIAAIAIYKIVTMFINWLREVIP